MYLEKYLQILKEHNPELLKDSFCEGNDNIGRVYKPTTNPTIPYFKKLLITIEAKTDSAALFFNISPLLEIPGIQLYTPISLGDEKLNFIWFPNGFNYNFNGEYGLFGYPEYGFIELKHERLKFAYLMPVRIPDFNNVFETFYPEQYAQYSLSEHPKSYVWIYQYRYKPTKIILAHNYDIIKVLYGNPLKLTCKPQNVLKTLQKNLAKYLEQDPKVNIFLNRALRLGTNNP